MANGVIVRDLVKHYGKLAALDGVSFSAEPGEILGLLGPNGAGKTTALECVVGLRSPDSGQIEICGVDAHAFPNKVKEIIGVQLQATALQDKLTPREAIRLFASFYHEPAPVPSLLKMMFLDEKADVPFEALSGGERQRLAVALAMVNQPRVVFLDEPTGGLDAQSRRQLHTVIREMRERGCTVVLSTHYIQEAQELCDTIAIIDHGKIIRSGTPDELIAAAGGMSVISFRTRKPIAEQFLGDLPAVRQVIQTGAEFRVTTANVSQTVSELIRAVQLDGNELIDLHVQEPSLEEAFVELTGDRNCRYNPSP